MAPGGSGGTQDEDAKNMFDRIGKIVHKKVHTAALGRSGSDLHGLLSRVKFNGQKTNVRDPCQLDHKYETNVGTGKSDPCDKRSPVRFSDESRSQCTKNRIKDSTSDNVGACAPYRRLHVCDRNLEEIEPEKIESTDNLLVDVLLAAKYEGQMIAKKLQEYDPTNYKSRICTVLARSFADIGDIIRGKDLYIGNKGEKKKLEEKLKKYFKELHNHLELRSKNHYQSNDTNYFELREDWWELNRLDVWKAMTCGAGTSAQYFRKTACGGGTSSTYKQCRCRTNDVPTYFDYVPQYLRWFEEWGEEFCRLRKHKLQNAIQKCRGKDKYGNDKYCSGNGYDCTKTVRAQEIYSMENNCPKCFFACNPFVKWLGNQKVEFLKQKQKYANEINASNQITKQTSNGPINNLYVKEFYEELEKHYGRVENFLEKLSELGICKEHPEVGEEKASNVDFTKDVNNKIFSRTEYCEPCPICGGHDDINKKLNDFCKKSNDNSSLYEEWNCYHGKGGNDKCILEYGEKGKKKKKVKDFYGFFTFWVTHMLDDSMEWKEKLKGCLKNGKKTCKKKQCRKNCECYESWVQQKENEWKLILEHFNTQEGFDESFRRYYVLETVLEDEYFDGISDAYADPQHMEKIRKTLAKKKEERDADFSNEKTIIDYLLDHEKEEAEQCKKCEDPPPRESAVPSPDTPRDTTVDPNHSDAENEEEEDEDEVEEEEEELKDSNVDEEAAAEGSGPLPDETEVVEETVAEVTEDLLSPPATTQNEVNPCQIVQTLFEKPGSLNEACNQKYGGNNSRLGWRCIPTEKTSNEGAATGSDGGGSHHRAKRHTSESGEKSGSSDSNQGSICVPPRRRRLYVGKLTQWANSDKTKASVSQGEDAASTSTSQTSLLRDAFIQSAAIETFFLWHRYKKEWEAQHGAGHGLSLLEPSPPSENPQNKLKSGTIPPDFLRLMFYTLGDYRDICIGVKEDVIETLKKSGDNNITKINEKIKTILNGGTSPGTHSPSSGTTPQQTWWEKNGPDIWKGMICALTYEEKSDGAKPTGGDSNTQKITQDTAAYSQILAKIKNQDGDYTYKKVELKDENSGGGPKPAGDTPLTQFVKLPPFFRWLHEWGSDFCGKRARMLGKIKHECKVDDNGGPRGPKQKTPQCSCYGEDCKDNLNKPPSTLSDLLCRECAKHCRYYKKWINTKRTEYEKQQNAYKGQKTKCQTQSEGGDNGFCGTVQRCSKAAAFLQKLGPCSKKDSGENSAKDNNIFEDEGDTFRPAENCKPCSEFKINCQNGNCSGANGNNCNGGKISAEKIGNGVDSTHKLDMLVSDNSKSGNGFGDLKDCEHAGIFKGIKENRWECRNVCGYVVCKPENGNGKTVSVQKGNDKHIITIRALVEHWVQNFLEDYNKIRKKLKPCMNSSDGSKCENKCKDKCTCVKAWIDEKSTEWKKIRDRFKEQYKDHPDYNVKSVLEDLRDRPEFKNAIKPCDFDKFKTSCGLNGDENSQKKESEENDHVLCMLKKLEKKISECTSQPSDKTHQTSCEKSPAHVEDDEPFEEENPVAQPNICPTEKPAQPEDEGGCEPPATQPEEPPPADSNPSSESSEETPKALKPEEEALAPVLPVPSAPKKPEPQPQPQTPPSDQPLDPTILQTTIPFGIAIALTSIVFLFLKKKTKSTIDLLRVINIPKSDYDIPTKLSPNRYIPYTSGKYRGKRYIYMEGDSGTDSGYTDHYSDITSSSESEYEEMDINDIYAPRAPKYKTLIEVVLEPSGKNTPTSGKNTPTSGNNTPTSGNNTPSDTQNDIQNDDIPSSKITDNEWNTLKHDFISNMLQNQPKDVPNDYSSGDIPFNTQPNTLYFDNNQEKPFITSIHDRNLYTGEEISYNIDMSTNTMDDIPINRDNNVYSGIDLINDTLSSNEHIDIYDELLKRKENELFGTNHVKQTSIHSVAKNTNSDPIHNQLELFHKWLDRHRDMCEKWENHHERLAKLKEEWENETHSGDINSGIPSNIPNSDIHPSDIHSGKLSDIPSDNNIHSDIHPSDIHSGKLSDIPSSNKTLNTDVSIQIHMDNPKPINEFTNMDTYPNNSSMDTILEDLDKYNEPYYDVQEDIYYDVNDHDTSTVDSNAMDVPSKVQIEMDVNTKLVKEKYPIADVWDI
ncbi:erythrocyte membrane protein 1 [Plasmodium falciparum IGH-CR14]|uniref:Erythrocyte membrane protein 1 n=1 Tax=Plasmodium falciparum IGH-CR14 TaxID=580059 RepID=A0A0L1I376_PLAFA|nr:erythrocyte membrane protein 1 [Plasmodium falciparum IGH-CR14]